MRIIYILAASAGLSLALLWLGIFGRLQRHLAFWGAVLSLGVGGALLTLAVLPGNSFYCPVITSVPTTQKIIALTYDDGPYQPYTAQLAQLLAEEQVQATFFIVGSNAAESEQNLQQVRQLQARGHEIALHAGYHRDLLKANNEELQENIAYGLKVLQQAGVETKYMRPPHGFKDWSVGQAAQQAGLELVNWSIIPRDWTNPGAQIIAQRVIEQAQPGAIVLLHDGDSPAQLASRAQTIAATKIIIHQLREQGYSFVTLSQLLQAAEK